jgi:hypothetical protein
MVISETSSSSPKGMTNYAIPVQPNTTYTVRFDTFFSSGAGGSSVVQLCSQGLCQDVTPSHSGWKRNYASFTTGASPSQGITVQLRSGVATAYVTQFVVERSPVGKLDFESRDKRRRWEYTATSAPAPVVPQGINSASQADFAGLVTRNFGPGGSFATRHYGVVLKPGVQRFICVKALAYDAASVGTTGTMRVVSDGVVAASQTINVTSTTTWTQSCGFFKPLGQFNELQFDVPAGKSYLVDDISGAM